MELRGGGHKPSIYSTELPEKSYDHIQRHRNTFENNSTLFHVLKKKLLDKEGMDTSLISILYTLTSLYHVQYSRCSTNHCFINYCAAWELKIQGLNLAKDLSLVSSLFGFHYLALLQFSRGFVLVVLFSQSLRHPAYQALSKNFNCLAV